MQQNLPSNTQKKNILKLLTNTFDVFDKEIVKQ